MTIKTKMLVNFKQLLICLFIKFVSSASLQPVELVIPKQKPNPVDVHLETNQISQGLEDFLHSKTMQKMARDIADNAVKNFVKELQNEKVNKAMKQKVRDIVRAIEEEEENSKVQTHKREHIAVPILKDEFRNNDKKDELKLMDFLKGQTYDEIESIFKYDSPKTTKKPSKVLDEEIAFTLLREPNPDGDNIGLDSLEEVATTVKSVPRKINGIYMRKLRRVQDSGSVELRFDI